MSKISDVEVREVKEFAAKAVESYSALVNLRDYREWVEDADDMMALAAALCLEVGRLGATLFDAQHQKKFENGLLLMVRNGWNAELARRQAN